jgi:hypothetical protein
MISIGTAKPIRRFSPFERHLDTCWLRPAAQESGKFGAKGGLPPLNALAAHSINARKSDFTDANRFQSPIFADSARRNHPIVICKERNSKKEQ